MTKHAGVAAVAVFLLGSASTALAIPVRYDFTTGTVAVGAPTAAALVAALNGNAITGSFLYDRDAPFVSPTGFPFPGGSFHTEVLSDLMGSVAGFTFSDPSGQGVVANDKFQRPPPLFPPNQPAPEPTDFLHLQAETAGPAGAAQPLNFNGFTLLDLALANVRFIWLETPPFPPQPVAVPDFLSDDSLPELPGAGVPGRIALDFGSANAAQAAIVFFEGLRVTRATTVPEPETLWLLGLGLGGLMLRGLRSRRTA
jgi:hypothetical protein